ncbi:hypothetical protein IWW51_003880 [Coemansia sp. RSA 2702]|nr:hypothetical protein IWW51_003880 [Coemansia sp. RSA 2702]KAJ2370725.1 hypothetical protein H4S01_000104 [Coemansia sp. RSA 2610]
MPDFAIFVPKHVDAAAIDTCLHDRDAVFEPIDLETFDPAAQHESHHSFIVLETDHFVVHIRGSKPAKCHYQSRNLIMSLLGRGYNMKSFGMRLQERDGLRLVTQQPMHYFAKSNDAECLYCNNATEDNTIVKYFDTDEDVNLAKFAKIVKSNPNCVHSHFIVNIGDKYRAVETDNVENTYVFSAALKYRIVDSLAKGTTSIEALIEEERNIDSKRPNPERQSGFKLCDSNGNIIADGETFALQILRREESDESEMDEDVKAGLSDKELLFYRKDFVGINSFMNDGNDHFLCGQVDYGTDFECETIDDIVYLKHGDKYFYNDLDSETNDIFISEKVPTKEQRIQIHYSDDGDIMLSAWGGRLYAICDWVKGSYGAIGFFATESQLRWGSPMKLRIFKY